MTFQTRISKIRSFSCVEVITQLHISELKEILRSQSLKTSLRVSFDQETIGKWSCERGRLQLQT